MKNSYFEKINTDQTTIPRFIVLGSYFVFVCSQFHPSVFPLQSGENTIPRHDFENLGHGIKTIAFESKGGGRKVGYEMQSRRELPWRVWNCIAFVYLFHGTVVESPPEIRLALAARGFRSIDCFDRHFHLIIRSSNEEACSARYNVSSNVRVDNRYRFDDVA